MDAVEFLKAKVRMCGEVDSCENCGLHKGRTDCNTMCFSHPAASVAAVEKWAAEHPVKTRQSEFLKMFPNAALFSFGTTDICDICPAKVDDTLECDISRDCGCHGCKRKYWLAEVDCKERIAPNECTAK